MILNMKNFISNTVGLPRPKFGNWIIDLAYILLLRDNKETCSFVYIWLTVVATKHLDQLKKDYAHRFNGTKF